MKTADVSVAIPFYNASGTIGRALESVARQTCPPAEVIVSDDGSAVEEIEALEELISQFSSYIPITLLKAETNHGPSTARNRAWNLAKGRWIAFLDADDSWDKTKLERQLKASEDNPSIVMWGTLLQFPGSEPTNSSAPAVRLIANEGLLWKNPFATSSVMVRRDIPLRFNTRMSYSEDFDLWCRILTDFGGGAVIQAALTEAYKRPFGEGGLSASLWLMQLGSATGIVRHSFRNRKLLPLLPLALLFSTLRFARRLWIAR